METVKIETFSSFHSTSSARHYQLGMNLGYGPYFMTGEESRIGAFSSWRGTFKIQFSINVMFECGEIKRFIRTANEMHTRRLGAVL